MGHILSCKTYVYKFESIEIIQIIFSHHNEIKLEINNRKITVKPPNIWS